MKRVETGHKAFDAAANHRIHGYIGIGNVFSSVQASSYIRGKSEVECNGFTFKPQELHTRDLKMFEKVLDKRHIATISKAIESSPTGNGICYLFFHKNGRNRVLHGFIVTDADYGLLVSRRLGPTRKSDAVMSEMKKRVTVPSRPLSPTAEHAARA